MNAKMKECFTPHAIMHSAIGFGLEIVAVFLISTLNMILLGVIIVVVAATADFMRK